MVRGVHRECGPGDREQIVLSFKHPRLEAESAYPPTGLLREDLGPLGM
jgi:hypothetical protein